MQDFVHGSVFMIYKLNGFDWATLPLARREALHRYLSNNDRQFAGLEPNRYGFAKVHWDGEIYYGSFTQQHVQPLRKYETAAHDVMEVDDAYEDRQFIYLAAKNLFVLEKRKFIQQGLDQALLRSRIENLIKSVVADYTIALELFRETVTKEQFIAEFNSQNNRPIRLSVANPATQVRDDFIFFNPHFEKNQISRELFRDKILPHTYSLEVTSTKLATLGKRPPTENEDLRRNPMARLLLELAEEVRELELYDLHTGDRRILKAKYDDKVVVDEDFGNPEDLTNALLEKLSELPHVKVDVRLDKQLRLNLNSEDGGN